ncbi:MAG: SDR family oxidoreductase [Chloroflexi bacterium]|nr:SDR family oxidoreductase [Chloroflexota bacterium]
MDLGIAGKTAFITGGSRGLGREAALALAAEGVNVAVCARGEDGLTKIQAELEAHGVKALAFQADLGEDGATAKAMTTVVDALGYVDILVNNVGGSMGTSGVLESSEDDFQKVFDLNLWATVRLMKLAAPGMKDRGWGRIINIASIFGREHGGTAPYMAAKASVIAVTKHLAIDLAPTGVCVNSIAPGSIKHDQGSWERFVDNNPKEVVDEFLSRNMPMGKFGWPEPVGATVAFLASQQAGLILGACINVDGGQSHNLF